MPTPTCIISWIIAMVDLPFEAIVTANNILPQSFGFPALLPLGSRRFVHRSRHAAEISAVNVHGFLRRDQHVLFSSRRNTFFQHIDEHVGVPSRRPCYAP